MEELIPIIFMLMVGSVLILRPLTKKLGLLMEALAKERLAKNEAPRGLDEGQMLRLTSALERLNSRVDLIDDRINFMEQLVENRSRTRQRLTG